MLDFNIVSPKASGLVKKAILKRFPKILEARQDPTTNELSSELVELISLTYTLCGLLDARSAGLTVKALFVLRMSDVELLKTHLSSIPPVFELLSDHGTYRDLLEALITDL